MLEKKVEVEGDSNSNEFLHIATYLPLRSWRHMIPFLRITSKVEKQLGHTRGLARYGLRADHLHKRFWTITVWQGKEFMNSFVLAEPHAEAVRRFKDWAGEGAAFVEWKSTTDSSINWPTALQKLQAPTFYYQPPSDQNK